MFVLQWTKFSHMTSYRISQKAGLKQVTGGERMEGGDASLSVCAESGKYFDAELLCSRLPTDHGTRSKTRSKEAVTTLETNNGVFVAVCTTHRTLWFNPVYRPFCSVSLPRCPY